MIACFMQSIRKRNHLFWIYSTSNGQNWQQQLPRKAPEQIYSSEETAFLDPRKPIHPQQDLFCKTLNINFTCLLAPFDVQNFKKSLECSQTFEDALVLAAKWPIYLTRYYFGKTINSSFLIRFILLNNKKNS